MYILVEINNPIVHITLMFKKNIGDKKMSVMKIKDFSAAKEFSKQFNRIFTPQTTFGDIAKVKAQQNSYVNPLGNHVEKHLQEQADYTITKTKERL